MPVLSHAPRIFCGGTYYMYIYRIHMLNGYGVHATCAWNTFDTARREHLWQAHAAKCKSDKCRQARWRVTVIIRDRAFPSPYYRGLSIFSVTFDRTSDLLATPVTLTRHDRHDIKATVSDCSPAQCQTTPLPCPAKAFQIERASRASWGRNFFQIGQISRTTRYGETRVSRNVTVIARVCNTRKRAASNSRSFSLTMCLRESADCNAGLRQCYVISFGA